MSILKDLIALGLAIIPPLLSNRDDAKTIHINRIRRAQDRLLDKRLRLEEELRKNK